MDIRLIFDEDEINYDKWRPRYCDELFEKIISYARLDSHKKVIEVGCGTGQATEPFLKTGCSLMALEYGARLAAFTAKKYENFRNLQVINGMFETFVCGDESINLLYSATAFHWIKEDVGYPKAYNMLKKGGVIALFWNKPFVARKDDPLHQKIQEIYGKYTLNGARPNTKPQVEDDPERYKKISDTIQKYGFKNVECHIYKKTRHFCAEDYISLLNTYSDHKVIKGISKQVFEEEMKEAIMDYGGILHVYDTMDLYLAKKL